MSAQENRRSRWTLIACSLGFVVVLLDVSVVNVALGAFRADLSASVTGLEWIVNAYTVSFASLLLAAGALGDRLGARRVFMAGFMLFAAASLCCGLAPTLDMLIASRVVQGGGAALLVPNSLSLIQQAFPDPVARSRAVGWWGAAGGIALAAGPVLGGLLVSHAGWRSVFDLNIPIAIAGLGLAWRYASRSSRNAQRAFDLPGQSLATVALVALAVALIGADRAGHEAATFLAATAVALLAGGAFVAVESRSAAPMLPLNLFASRAFSVATVSGVLVNFAYYGLIFVFSLYFQGQRGFSAQETGLAFLPMTLVLMVSSVLGGRLIQHVGARFLMVLGQVAAAAGYLLLLVALRANSYWLLVVPMSVAAGGVALTVPTMTNVTLSAVDASRAGMASGVLNTARQVGGLLGVAVCGSLVRGGPPGTFLSGMQLALVMAVAALVVGALMSLWRLESGCGSHPLRRSGEPSDARTAPAEMAQALSPERPGAASNPSSCTVEPACT